MSAIGQLFAAFFQIGLLSIGGGYAIIPLIQEQVVTQYQWITQRVFTDIITISQMTPGPLAVNTSTFVGIQIAGIPGALAATVGCVLAGVCIALVLYSLLQKYRRSTYALEVLQGMKAASVGLIASAAATILMLTFFGAQTPLLAALDIPALALFAVSLLALRRFKVGPIALMLATGAVGLLIY